MGAMKLMKHILLISALSLAFFSGCVKNDAYTPESDPHKIHFTSPVVDVITKANNGEISGIFPTSENFTVWAVLHNTSFEGWTTNSVTYMNQVECAYDGGSYNDSTTGQGGWSSSAVPGGKAYYWPFEGVLTFAAYSPSSAHSVDPQDGSGTGIFTYGANGLSIEKFSINSEVKNQKDLMFSERSYNRTTSTGGENETYDGVDLTFHHALSSIRFNVQKKEKYPGHIFTLTNIFIGDVKYKGSFAEDIDETSSTYSSAPAWDVDDDAKVSIPYMLEIDSDPETSEIEPLTVTKYGTANFDEVPQGAILMPQVFKEGSDVKNGDAYIVIDYMVEVEGFLHPVTQTATVRLSTITDRWEMGKRYTYNIILGYDTITVNPTVPGWVDVTIEAGIK
jgi:hypothetical protein